MVVAEKNKTVIWADDLPCGFVYETSTHVIIGIKKGEEV